MRLICGLVVLAVGLSATCSGQGTGSIRGQVNFVGSVPQQQVHKVSGDKVCEEFHSQKPILQEDLVVGQGNTVKNVVVWISSGWPEGKEPKTRRKTAASLVQQGCEFIPHVLAIQAGQPVEVKNADPTIHNVNARPKTNDPVNQVVVPGGKILTLRFDKPEVAVKLRSDIHPWMTAWVAVFDHGAFDVTAEDGRFEFPDLPPGEYILETWHEKLGQASAEVLVQEGAPAEVIFTYSGSGLKSGIQMTKAEVDAEQTTGPKEY